MQVLWSFPATNATVDPYAAVTEASDGMLYGTTYGNGIGTNRGVVFKIGRDGNHFSIMHRFTVAEGDNPSAPVIEATNGVLYGTTLSDGGQTNGGSLYRINKDGSGYAVFRTFTFGTNDGGNPACALLQASDGLLYGTTQYGGAGDSSSGGDGVIFRMDLNGNNFTILHSFTNGDGLYPAAALIEGTNGALYGTASDGGISHNGTLFEMDKSGSNFNVIHYFTGGSNGFAPFASLLKGPNGKLYGTTISGGTNNQGVAFSLDYNGSNYLVLHQFGAPADGQNPNNNNLIPGPDGNLYGTSYFGGGTGVSGTVFQMNADGSNYGLPIHFVGTNGANPNSLIVGTDGALYGTCNSGGPVNNGTVFVLTGNVNVPDILAAPLNLGVSGWRISGHGTANRTYTLLATTNLLVPASNWLILGPVNADGSGNWQTNDLTSSPRRFYQTSYP